MPTRSRVSVVAVIVAGLLAGCSDSEPTDSTVGVTDPFAPAECAEADPVLLVDQIDAAVSAVEQDLGGPQLYYEINATPVVVNLFVAGDEGLVTPYAFAAGELTSQDPVAGATGNTFPAASMDFDATTVTSCVAVELSTSTQEVFIVLGGPDGTVRYSMLTRSTAGGQLLIDLAADGTVLGVEPV